MSDTLSVAAIQLTSTKDVEANLGRCVELCRAAAGAGARLLVLPENYGFLGGDGDKLAVAEAVEDGRFTVPLRRLAESTETFVLAGSMPERGPDAAHTYNTSVLIGPDGKTRAVYRKIHLFDVALSDGSNFQESKTVASGKDLVLADVDGWSVGLSICYDLRFPELYRGLSQKGARILTVPAAFTLHTGKDHWDVLLAARAIENLSFVIASGQFGQHGGGRSSWGKSQVIDPWGTVLARAPEREGYCLAVLDRRDQDRIRREVPALGNRRL